MKQAENLEADHPVDDATVEYGGAEEVRDLGKAKGGKVAEGADGG